ncbi:MAG TPA: hypothetical protein VG247_03975 [Pseudonocardiaceae bacterium]|jgi:hypothetical protein|nr:hypothetical protein [Pseudonocardiaceae bacterium]
MDQGRARVARVLLVVAILPALLGVWLLPWALRTVPSGPGNGGIITVRECARTSLITWSCVGTFGADDPMACEGEPGCPIWTPVVLDDPSRRAPGAVVWASKPVGSSTVYPWGWREEDLVPFAIVAGLACFLLALVTAIRRRFGLVTSFASGACVVFLVPVAVWLLA